MVHNCANAFVYDDFHTNKSNNKIVNEAVVKAVDECMQQLQKEYGRPLSKTNQWDIVRAFNIMDKLTGGKKLPRLFQVMTMLSILNGKHTVVRAGTGSGKTIAMALAMLVRSHWLFLTIAPLLALQHQHVSPEKIVFSTRLMLLSKSGIKYLSIKDIRPIAIITLLQKIIEHIQGVSKV